MGDVPGDWPVRDIEAPRAMAYAAEERSVFPNVHDPPGTVLLDQPERLGQVGRQELHNHSVTVLVREKLQTIQVPPTSQDWIRVIDASRHEKPLCSLKVAQCAKSGFSGNRLVACVSIWESEVSRRQGGAAGAVWTRFGPNGSR